MQSRIYGASVENATLIQNKETDIAMIQNDIAFMPQWGELPTFTESGAYDI